MKTFNVRITLVDGRTTFVKCVKALDAWQAQTLVWFQVGSFRADGQAVTYNISEVK